MQCELPEDWNPNKPIRMSMAEWDYELFATERGGRTLYETWKRFDKYKGCDMYCLVQYRWDNDDGWVPLLVSTPLPEFTGVK